jgi:hypothetical protein
MRAESCLAFAAIWLVSMVALPGIGRAGAGERPQVAVLDLRERGGVTGLGAAISDALARGLEATGRFEVRRVADPAQAVGAARVEGEISEPSLTTDYLPLSAGRPYPDWFYGDHVRRFTLLDPPIHTLSIDGEVRVVRPQTGELLGRRTFAGFGLVLDDRYEPFKNASPGWLDVWREIIEAAVNDRRHGALGSLIESLPSR